MLRKYFDERIARAAEIDSAYAVLWQAMAKFTEGGGKRLRPYLTVLGYEAFDGADYGKILQLAAAQELLHLSLLIHDDLMDRDYERYGHDNIAGIFRKKYARAAASSEQADHNAQGTALLAGDLLLADAHQLVMQSGFSEAQKAKASDLLKTVMFEVVGGQLLDVQGGMQAFDKVDSIKVARYKTASYSFIGPLCVGATMAGATEKMLGLMELFAEQAGVAHLLRAGREMAVPEKGHLLKQRRPGIAHPAQPPIAKVADFVPLLAARFTQHRAPVRFLLQPTLFHSSQVKIVRYVPGFVGVSDLFQLFGRVEQLSHGLLQAGPANRFDFLRCPAEPGAVEKMRGGLVIPLRARERIQHKRRRLFLNDRKEQESVTVASTS